MLEAFALCHGIFRPGETVDFKVLRPTRNSKVNSPFPWPGPSPHPPAAPWRRGTYMLSAEWRRCFQPAAGARSHGKYVRPSRCPAEKKRSASPVRGEDFAPPRIEVKLSTGTPFVVADGDASVNVDVKYSFGAPAGGAPWESRLRISPHQFFHPEWRAFTFPSGNVLPPLQATLKTAAPWTKRDKPPVSRSVLDSEWKGTSFAMSLTVRVREDGGRWVARNISIPYYRNPVLLGYEMPRQDPRRAPPIPSAWLPPRPTARPRA